MNYYTYINLKHKQPHILREYNLKTNYNLNKTEQETTK